MTAIKSVVERYLLVWLVLLSGLAYFSEQLLPVDIFVATQSYLPYIIAVTMFAIGWMLPKDEVQQVVARWPTVLSGTAIQFASMPTLAFLLASQFQVSGSMLIGVIMVGCVPGAMASNVLTLVARGNTSYSVSLTTMATLLSPITVPLALQLTLGETVSREIVWGAATKLSWMVVIPVIVGHTVSRRFPQHQQLAGVVGSMIANLTILWIVAVVVALNRDRLNEELFTNRVVIVLILLNVLGYTAGFVGGKVLRLPTGMRRALTLEVGMQNAGLGAALVRELFDDPSMAVPPALYTFGCMLTGTILARIWQRVPLEDSAGPSW